VLVNIIVIIILTYGLDIDIVMTTNEIGKCSVYALLLERRRKVRILMIMDEMKGRNNIIPTRGPGGLSRV
jgi:hypothetical protein